MAPAGCHAPVRHSPMNTTSPDGHINIMSRIGADGRFAVRVVHGGAVLVATSPVSLTLADEPFGPLVAVAQSDTGPREGCAGRAITARERAGRRRTIRLEVAACDTGAAFRLVLPAQRGVGVVRIAGEQTAFAVPRDDRCQGVRHAKFFNSHEGDYAPVRLRDIHPGDLYDLPLTCVTGRAGETYALTESRIENYSAAYLTGTADGSGVAVKLTPRPDNDALAVVSRIPPEGLATPWRVVMIADRPERMIANDLVRRLAASSRIVDAAWVRPGKPHGAGGPGCSRPPCGEPAVTWPPTAATSTSPRIWACPTTSSTMAGHSIPPGKDTPADVLRPAANIDVPALVAYGRARGVRLWLWADWKSLDGRMAPVLDRWRQWGVAGIKVDFIYRQDQEVVAFYHRLLGEAARRHLLVDIHATFVPRGLDRTYPNFLTQEGAMGNEYNRWSRKVTAGYNVRAAYSRATIGPMDYIPGGFRNVTPGAFSPRRRRRR